MRDFSLVSAFDFRLGLHCILLCGASAKLARRCKAAVARVPWTELLDSIHILHLYCILPIRGEKSMACGLQPA